MVKRRLVDATSTTNQHRYPVDGDDLVCILVENFFWYEGHMNWLLVCGQRCQAVYGQGASRAREIFETLGPF